MPRTTALLVIDMQFDFCGSGGYVRQHGVRSTLTSPGGHGADPGRPPGRSRLRVDPVYYTREGHRPDLTDLPANKRWRSRQVGAGIGDPGHVRTDPGPGGARLGNRPGASPCPRGSGYRQAAGKAPSIQRTSSSYSGRKRIENLILTGITTDVCVHTTMREANDRGFECLLLEDCCGATDQGNHLAAIKMIKMQGGVFGSVSNSLDLIQSAEK